MSNEQMTNVGIAAQCHLISDINNQPLPEDSLNLDFSPLPDSETPTESIISNTSPRPNIVSISPELTFDSLGLPTLETNLRSYLRSPNKQAREELITNFARIFSALSDPAGKQQILLQEIGQWLARLAPELIAVFGQQAEEILNILMALYDEAEAGATGQSILTATKTIHTPSYCGGAVTGYYQEVADANYSQEMLKKVANQEIEEINDEKFFTCTNSRPVLTITPQTVNRSRETRENIDPATANWLADLSATISHLARDCYEAAFARIRRAFTLGQPGEIHHRGTRPT
jgi:hypothetical protein